jgi:hypothetical protein
MNRLIFIILLVLCSGARAENLTLQEWLDLYVNSCVGSGSSSVVSGSIGAGAELSLRKFSTSGNLTGELTLSRSSYRLLSEGISNKMTDVAAGEADKVRECLAPIRQILVEAMSQQISPPSSDAEPIYILSPEEEKVMKALANHRGEDGKTGKNVLVSVITDATGMSDIRFRTTMRLLTSKVLATQSQFAEIVGVVPNSNIQMVDVVSLWDKGEDYVLKMGYAK